jgi:hypothetical protein
MLKSQQHEFDPASYGILESEGRQMKQCGITYIIRRKEKGSEIKERQKKK